VVVKPIQAPLARPSADEPLTRLPVIVSNSLKQALANRLQQMSVADNKTDGTVEWIYFDRILIVFFVCGAITETVQLLDLTCDQHTK